MYFQSFPYTYYTLDDRITVQVVKNILLRVIFNENFKNNFSLFDDYDVREGETPEIVAFKFYNNTELHWVLLHLNEVIDPRFNWPLSTSNLLKYVEGKYGQADTIVYYESDATGEKVNANVTINSNNGFGNFYLGNTVTTGNNTGLGYISSKTSNSRINVIVTEGGFSTGNQIKVYSNTDITANITSTSVTGVTAITGLVLEDRNNEARRRIKVLKPQYVQLILTELNSLIGSVNVA